LLVVVEHAHDGLQMTLRLHIAAHHAEAHHRLALLGQEGRDDRVERALAAFHHVGRLRIHREPTPRFCRLMPVPGTTTPEPKPM
jgi:hypothetical protein